MTFQITIDKGVAIPPRTYGGRTPQPAPFGLDRMQVGDSAYIPVTAQPTAAKKPTAKERVGELQSYLSGRCKDHRDLKSGKWTIRANGEGVRIWRVA